MAFALKGTDTDVKKDQIIYVCAECGKESAKWLGKCPDCGSWNSFEEQRVVAEKKNASVSRAIVSSSVSTPIGELTAGDCIRVSTGIGEFDRVLGGGLVLGSVVLISGEPGIGKTTLLMQMCGGAEAGRRLLYVSGEESCGQIKLRAERLGINRPDMFVLSETDTESILAECERVKPDIVIIDSVQTLYSERYNSSPGSITQVKEGAMTFIRLAKTRSIPVILVGHVNKEGGISGPKILEHMVDAVLYFEGEQRHSYRIIRAMKNRFGSTNEIGVFEMRDFGLEEISNPSEALLEERSQDVAGSCAACVMEGSRPLVTEIQSLVSATVYPAPRRTSDGFDYNRACLLLAVLERRLGLKFSTKDVYINVVGGVRTDEPAADLPVALALISGIGDRVLPSDFVAFGEIGLAGDIRSVTHTEYRIREAARLGFRRIMIPKRGGGKINLPEGIELIRVASLYEALAFLSKIKNAADQKKAHFEDN